MGQGAGAHYSAVLPAVSSGTGGYNELEDIMPLPKAGPLKRSSRGKERKTAILTDTPEKNALEKEVKKTAKRPKARQLFKSKEVNG